MSDTRFTPGPWSTSAIPEGGEFEVLDPEGGYICGVAFLDDGPTPAEAIADAHLIAAAPDLYEALDTLATLADNFSVSGVYFSEPCMTKEVAALEKAWAALAKARGEQSA